MEQKWINGLLSNKGIVKYLTNTSWLIADKITTIIFGFLVGIWVARYLGPENYGILNYVIALVGLLSPLAQLGFSGIITRDLIKDKSGTYTSIILSTGFVFKLIGGLVLFILVFSYMYFFNNEPIYIYLGIIISLEYIFKPFEVIEYYFMAKVKTRYIFISKLIGQVLSSILKIIFILFSLGLLYFAFAHFAMILFSMIALLFFFILDKGYVSLQYVSLKKGINLLKESWPLIFSGLFALIYFNIDKVMIQQLLGSYYVGQYSVAVKISSIFYFIPSAIRSGILPAFVNAKEKDKSLYYNRLAAVFTLMSLFSYLIMIPIYIFSNDIIGILFGPDYSLAGDVLKIHVLSLLFFFLGVGRGLWVVNESFFKFDLFSNIGAGIINIILNMMFIPRMGILGAAYATIISYSFTFFFSNLFFKPANIIFIMQLKGMFLINLTRLRKTLND